MYFESYDRESFFNTVSHKLPKYDAIFIDEVQDYKASWLQIIKRNFLQGNGEFVVFGDPKQNIYHREIDSQGNILLGVIPGLWNKDLIKSHRFSNPSLANLAMEFQRHFIGNSDDIEGSNNLNSGIQFNLMQYRHVPDQSDSVALTDIVYSICED